MSTVRQLLKEKGNDVWSVIPQTTTLDALKLMAAKNIGALLVAENGKVVGIFSERDYARQATLHENFTLSIPVKELMSKNVTFISPEDAIETCMQLMTSKRFRHIPVIEGDQVVGLISIGDVVNSIISDQKETIKQLGSFISGEGYGANL